ncbi:distal tail protein Dit [Clostridium peptidivorans]|uniref:distal tail protein Dit n=1 Tax=Clostridium peptidivorans TaxID=100174 RepID=UPI000BE43587|nr:distal tail protein Dit [Clostridium peptidivorans]
MIRGFTFNDKHNYKDFGLVLESKQILPPSKQKIKINVPFMSGTYDFSVIGSDGEQIFEERQIQVVLGLATRSKEKLHVLYSQILEWLQDIGRRKLVFDDICDYYFEAEVENASSFEEMCRFGKIAVTFICQPFKIGVDYEGEKLWDSFNFDVDVLQDTGFDVAGNKTVNIINVGRAVCPVINADASMSVVFNSKVYNLAIGDNKFYDLKLQPGENNFIINGTGHTKFIFRKQVL